MQSSKEQQGGIKRLFLKLTMQKIEENNRMQKTGDLIKKIGDIKGTFHDRMGQ